MDLSKNLSPKLVIIDDDKAHLRMLQAALACDSLEIFATASSEEGFELVRSKRPLMVLLDLYLPGCDGMEMLEKLVDLDAGINVIIMTGQYNAESAVEAIQNGATDYMTKPLSITKLRNRISQLISELQTHQQSYELDLALMKREFQSGPCITSWPEELVWVGTKGYAARRDNGPIPLALFPQGCLYRERAIHALETQRHPWRIA